jgi:tetratricopeptide (TPR) repeat protein
LARQLGDLLRELSALNRLGVIANRQGKVDEAERLWQDVYQRAEAAGNRELAMSACNNLGVLATRKRDYLVAQDNYQQALALAREIGSQHGIVVFLNNLADGHIRLGELAAARAELSEALNLALRLGAQPWMIIAVTALGYLAHAEGQTERALALIGMARCQPAWSEENQRELEFHVSEWGLAPAVLEAGYAKGAAFDWETTLQELVNLLETPKQP